jgi:hypothetical protein
MKYRSVIADSGKPKYSEKKFPSLSSQRNSIIALGANTGLPREKPALEV